MFEVEGVSRVVKIFGDGGEVGWGEVFEGFGELVVVDGVDLDCEHGEDCIVFLVCVEGAVDGASDGGHHDIDEGVLDSWDDFGLFFEDVFLVGDQGHVLWTEFGDALDGVHHGVVTGVLGFAAWGDGEGERSRRVSHW